MAMNDCMKQQKQKKKKFNITSINVKLVNQEYDDFGNENDSYTWGDSTFRQDGFSIGKDYMRFDGSTLTRGELLPSSLIFDPNSEESLIGQGAFSQVHRGIWTMKNDNNGEVKGAKASKEIIVAIKQCSLLEASEQRRGMLLKELRALCTIDCECLLRMHGAYLHGDTVTTVLEYMDRGSLEQVLQRQKEMKQHPLLPSDVLAAIAYQMLWGLSYLHHEKILHRDIKAGNCLLHSNGQVKLCDFGIASISDQSLHVTTCGTTKFLAPERLRSKPYGRSSDIWSLGLVLLECATGISPWKDCDSLVTLVITVEETEVDDLIPKDLTHELREILVCCLQKDPGKYRGGFVSV